MKVFVAFTLLAAGLPARAHPIVCAQSVGPLQLDGAGGVVVADQGLPVFGSPPSPLLHVTSYPAVLGFRFVVENRGQSPVETTRSAGVLSDYPDATWYMRPGDDPSQANPGLTTTLAAVRIVDREACLALAGATTSGHLAGPGQAWRAEVLESRFVVSHPGGSSECRAQVVCGDPAIAGTPAAPLGNVTPAFGPAIPVPADAVSVKTFGAKGDWNGTTGADDTVAIQAAVDAADSVFFPDGRYRITSTIKLRSGNRLYAAGTRAWIENTGGTGRDTAVFAVGNIGRFEARLLDYKRVAPPAAGASTLTFVNPEDSAGFAPGDFVFVRGGSHYTEGGVDFFEFGSVNRVVSTSPGIVTLRHAIDEAVEDCFVGNITRSGLTSPVTGDPLFATEGVVIEGLSARTRRGIGAPLFREGGGVLAGAFRFRDVEVDSFAYGNAWAHSTVSADRVLFERHLWEFGVNSHHVQTKVRYARMTSRSSFNRRPIRTAENGRDLTLSAELIDLSAFVSADVPIYISNSRRCDVRIGELRAPNATSRLATFASLPQVPSPPPTRENRLSIGSAIANRLQYYATFVDAGRTLRDNALEGSRFYGSVQNGAVSLDGLRPRLRDVWFETGGIQLGRNVATPEIIDTHAPIQKQ